MNERWKTFAWAAALFYMVLLSFNWSALTRRADLQTKSMLDYAMLDYDATVMAAIDSMLMHAADSIVAEFGAPSPPTDASSPRPTRNSSASRWSTARSRRSSWS